MEYSSYDIDRKLKIKKQNLTKLRKSLLQKGMDFYSIDVGQKRFYKYTSSGFKKLKNRKNGVCK